MTPDASNPGLYEFMQPYSPFTKAEDTQSVTTNDLHGLWLRYADEHFSERLSMFIDFLEMAFSAKYPNAPTKMIGHLTDMRQANLPDPVQGMLVMRVQEMNYDGSLHEHAMVGKVRLAIDEVGEIIGMSEYAVTYNPDGEPAEWVAIDLA